MQVLIWMLCIYLVLKGVELRGIAAASTHETRDSQVRGATVWAFIAWIAAAFFFYLSLEQGSAVPENPTSTYPY